ncbi:MAG: MFS transporter [Anaerolineae bacterium]
MWRKAPRPRDAEERNIALLYGEVVFAAVLAAAGAFNATYVLRWGGSPTLIGLLSSAPALVAVLLFLPAARLLERQKSYRPFVVWSLFGARIGYLAIAMLPFLTARGIPGITVGLLVAMSAPSVLFSTGWNPLLADVIPERQRATVFSWRNILSSATIAILTYAAGLALDRGTFPANYQWLYAIGIVGGLVSTWLISRIRIPEAPPAEVPLLHRRVSLKQGIKEALQENPIFGRLIVNTLVLNLGAWMVGPLFIIFFVQELGAADSWVGFYTTLIHVGVVVGYWVCRKMNHGMGDPPALLLALPFVASYPILVALLPRLPVILIIGLLAHLFVPGVDLNHSLIFMRNIPPSRRHTGIAFYSMVMNLGAFVCPIVGVALAGLIGIRNALVIGGILRLLGVAMFFIFPMDENRLTWQGVRGGLGALVPHRQR